MLTLQVFSLSLSLLDLDIQSGLYIAIRLIHSFGLNFVKGFLIPKNKGGSAADASITPFIWLLPPLACLPCCRLASLRFDPRLLALRSVGSSVIIGRLTEGQVA